jgi:hypothetical protein
LEKHVSVDKVLTVKPVDNQTNTAKVQSPAPPAEPEIARVPTETSSQDKSGNPSSGTTSVNQHESKAASNPVESGSNPASEGNSTNSSNNQVSRGESAIDNSKYPLLSKINGSFGQFRYRELAGGRIEVDPQWVATNIVTITLPGLNRQVQVHKNAAENFITAFNYIKNGTAVVNGREVALLSLIQTMDGTYVARHVNWDSSRGLSNHSWGTAIDINANGHFGYVDPQKDQDDPNLILWEKAFKPAGFSWGNRYSDSMHYELIK